MCVSDGADLVVFLDLADRNHSETVKQFWAANCVFTSTQGAECGTGSILTAVTAIANANASTFRKRNDLKEEN